MFIFNMKINGSKIFKFIFIGIILFLVLILSISVYKVFNGANNSVCNESCNPKNNFFEIKAQNYTNILKAVHDNIDSYIGLNIGFSGYIYRVSNLQKNQFVLARDMLINSNSQSVVVGFLCEYNDATNLKDNTWVSIKGEITKGNYHGDMPIIKVKELNIIDKPNKDEYVYPPDDSYIPTTGLI